MGWGALHGAGVLLFLGLVVFSQHFMRPFYYLTNEDSVIITDIEAAGFGWRLMEVALFNWIGLPLFREHWQGYAFLSSLVSLGVAFSVYLLWLELALQLKDRRGAALGGHAPGVCAAFLTALAGFNHATDLTGVSYRAAAFFCLLTLVFALRYHRTGRLRWWPCVMLAYLGACLSHSFSWPLWILVLLMEGALRRHDLAPGAGRRVVVRTVSLSLVPLAVVLITAHPMLLQALSAGSLAPRNPGADIRVLMLSRMFYVVSVTTLVHALSAIIPSMPGPAEWVAEVVLLVAIGLGVVRLQRRNGLDIIDLLLLFVAGWFLLTIPSLLMGNMVWSSGSHRFNFLFPGPIIVLSYLAVTMLDRGGRLAFRCWRPRWTGATVWAVVLLVLPSTQPWFSLADVMETGSLNLRHPCPALEACGAMSVPPVARLRAPGPAPRLSCADLTMMELPDIRLPGADLGRANLSGAHLHRARLTRARLPHSCAFYVDLREASLEGGDLRGAQIIGAFLNRANLTRADLRGASLRSTHLWGANLKGADLSDSDLVQASFVDADLRGANLARANLSFSDLGGADLRGADLRGAILLNVSVDRTRVEGANLAGAMICQQAAGWLRHGSSIKGTPSVVPCGSVPFQDYLLQPCMARGEPAAEQEDCR